MTGKELLYSLRQLLNEDASSGFLDDKTSYTYLWQAATEFVKRTNLITKTQSITTVASQENYTLSADFCKLYLTDSDKNYIIKYNNGTDDTFVRWKEYSQIVYENQTTDVTIPSWFTIVDEDEQTQITGSATSSNAASNGTATLTSSTSDFTNASVGDYIYNTTDGSEGVILSKTSTTVIVTALFGGTDNDWDSGDAYIVQPQAKMRMVLAPPPSTASHTITFYYVAVPEPVFSIYGAYKIPTQYIDAIVSYAAWKYKYRDREPDFGDKWFKMFDYQVKGAVNNLRTALNRNSGMSVSFRRR